MPPIIISDSDSEEEDRKPELSPPRRPLIDPSLDREINELKKQESKDKDERSELLSRLDKVNKRLERSQKRRSELVEKKNAALDLVPKEGEPQGRKTVKKETKVEVKKEVKEGNKKEAKRKGRKEIEKESLSARAPDTQVARGSILESRADVDNRAATPVVPRAVRNSIVKEEFSSDSENGVPRFTVARSEPMSPPAVSRSEPGSSPVASRSEPGSPSAASRTSRQSTRALSSISQSHPLDSQPAAPASASASDDGIEIYEKVRPWAKPTEDNDQIAASDAPFRKFGASEMIKMWPKLRIPNLPWPTTMFTRRFLSKVLGGGEQMVECVISAAKQRTQIYPIKVYYCERAEWSPDMPSEPGAHGVVYATAPDPRDSDRPVDFNYSSYAVFCRRAANKWDYCGEYEITRRKFIPGEWGRISEVAKKSWSEGFSGKTGKKWGINILMKRGLLNPGDPMPSPEDIIALIDQGRLLLECQIYKCVDYKLDFYETLKEAWLREIEIDQEIKREEEEDEEGRGIRLPEKRKRRLTTTTRVPKDTEEEEEEEEEEGDGDIRLPVKRKRRSTTARRVSKDTEEEEEEEEGEEALVERQETRRKRRRRRRIDDEEGYDDDEDEDYTEN